MGMARRRSSRSVTGFLQDISDDIKDFIDDEVVERSRDTERDLRRAGRNLVDDEDDRDPRRGQASSSRDQELDELRDAIKLLSQKVSELAAKNDAPANNDGPVDDDGPAKNDGPAKKSTSSAKK
jgi:hypothetical protein